MSEREDKLLNAQLDTLVEQNAEVAGDDDSEDEEDTGMGDIDLTNSGVHADWVYISRFGWDSLYSISQDPKSSYLKALWIRW